MEVTESDKVIASTIVGGIIGAILFGIIGVFIGGIIGALIADWHNMKKEGEKK